LEVTNTKLEASHVSEIIDLLALGNLHLLSLRETKLGPLRCGLITRYLLRGDVGRLKYLDISANAIGGNGIADLLDAAAKTTLAGVAVDANFFKPAPEAVRHLAATPLSAISLKGLHWDYSSSEAVGQALARPSVTYWDLGAQIVHQHSDPDLSAEVAHSMLRMCHSDVECLLFANHRLTRFNATCIAHVRLKALSLANSGIQEDSLESLIPLLDRLVWLDLQWNSIVFHGSDFLSAAAASKSLKTLVLTKNDVGDTPGRIFFHDLLANESQIKVLRMHSCFMRRNAAAEVVRMLASGRMSFDELDLGGNEMFHEPVAEIDVMGQSRIEYFYVGANGAKAPALAQLFGVVRGMQYLEIDRTPVPTIIKCGRVLEGIMGLSICRAAPAPSEEHIIDVLSMTKAHELWAVNSISQKTLGKVLARCREIPLCMAIHIGTDIEQPINPPIPVIVDGE
jgi:hypothetical protein